MKTATQEQLKVAANHAARTFTIRTYVNDKFVAKYRTIPLSKDEFESATRNTESDWKQFLKSDDYYNV